MIKNELILRFKDISFEQYVGSYFDVKRQKVLRQERESQKNILFAKLMAIKKILEPFNKRTVRRRS